MTEAITFLHLTDLHLGDPASDPTLYTDTVKTMRAVLGLIDAIDPRPSFIAVSGDLTNRGDPESYRVLRELMQAMKAPVIYALGNHDVRPAFYREILGRGHDLDAPYDHDLAIAGIHVIALDSSKPGRIGGALEDRQFAFLDAALSRHPGSPKLLMIHHPPALHDDPADAWERLTVADSARLGDMIADRDVVGVLSGHIHQDRVAHWRDVPVIVNTGQHCALDPSPKSDEIRLVAGASFGRGVLRGHDLSMRFITLPSDQRELGRLSAAKIRNREEAAIKAGTFNPHPSE